MSNRKEEILIVALHLFARDGYEAVSVSQIAGELDMTKGALYRHYKSKRDIFDCIVQRMEQQDGEQAAEYAMPEDEKESMPGTFAPSGNGGNFIHAGAHVADTGQLWEGGEYGERRHDAPVQLDAYERGRRIR